VSTTGTTRERDIETARRFYADLLAFEARMEAAGDRMHNRGRWLDAERHLREAREALELFIGERITADLREASDRQREMQAPDLDAPPDADGEPDA
jgi:hypothetical protein